MILIHAERLIVLMSSKIIFFDIDGTIRDFDGYIPDSAVETIKMLRKNGHKVCISTGRPYCQIENKVMDIGFDGVISGLGSHVEYEGRCINHFYFVQPIYIELCKFLLENNCIFEIQTYKKSFILKNQAEELRKIGEQISGNLGKKAKKLIEMPDIIDSYMDITKVEKIVFFCSELTKEKFMRDWGKKIYITPMSIPTAGRYGGEISPIGVNKTEGIRNILMASGYKKEDVIAIGDSENDLGMLQFAAVGVAMGNGTGILKDAADLITDTLRSDGIKKAVLKLGLL
jgi:Cof subfamily protein (haloacid dehalogenase superfamily)